MQTWLSSNNTNDLKLTYQHIGGVLLRLPDGKKDTFVLALSQHEKILEIEALLVIEASVTTINHRDASVVLASMRSEEI